MKKFLYAALFCLLICIILVFSGCSIIGQPAHTKEPDPGSVSAPESEPEASSAEESSESAPQQSAEPAGVPISFTINHYALPPDADAYIGDYKEEYKGFVDAILAYKDSFAFSDGKAKKAVLGAISRFPLSALCEPFDIDFETPETPIRYRDSQTDFESKVLTFETEVASIITSGVFEQDTEIERAIYLYGTVSANHYNAAAASDAYSFLTEKKGSSFGFSEALGYLLGQVGSKAILATGTTEAGKDHRWVIFTINGQSYNMDPAFENGATGGKGLAYFAMSDKLRKKSGCSVPYATGENGYFEKNTSNCSDTQFDSVFSGTSTWKLDRASHILYLAASGSDGYSSSLRTDTFEAIY